MSVRCVSVLAGLAMMCCAGLSCGQVYKWVDDKGRTHYGQQPPPASVAAPKKLDIETTGSNLPSSSTTCYSIQCQYERMRDDRLLREAEWRKDEESRAKVAAQRRAAQEAAAPVTDPRWSGTIYPGGAIIGGRPIYRQRPILPAPTQPSGGGEPNVSIRMPGER